MHQLAIFTHKKETLEESKKKEVNVCLVRVDKKTGGIFSCRRIVEMSWKSFRDR